MVVWVANSRIDHTDWKHRVSEDGHASAGVGDQTAGADVDWNDGQCAKHGRRPTQHSIDREGRAAHAPCDQGEQPVVHRRPGNPGAIRVVEHGVTCQNGRKVRHGTVNEACVIGRVIKSDHGRSIFEKCIEVAERADRKCHRHCAGNDDENVYP